MNLRKTACGCAVLFVNIFKYAERLFLVHPSFMHWYRIIADHNGELRSDIAAARKERRIISTADLSAAVEAQSQHLEQALQLEVRQLENQLTLMKLHLALLGERCLRISTRSLPAAGTHTGPGR